MVGLKEKGAPKDTLIVSYLMGVQPHFLTVWRRNAFTMYSFADCKMQVFIFLILMLSGLKPAASLDAPQHPIRGPWVGWIRF
jgi:hypothetical protein